tara:strand:- start:869 stop:1927 length:1059 start_codon:yes stop_codon:yes gene_type:complete
MNTTEKHEDRSHAFASPSDSKRWMTCHGSLNLEKKLKEKKLIPEWDEGSPAAAEGTRLHEVAEKVLSGEILICPTEVKPYVDFCRSITPEGAEYFIEKKVPLFYSKGDTGSVDYAVIDGEVLHIADLKSGRIKVDPVFNYQMLTYALGLVTPAIKEIHMTVFQYDEPHTWAISIQEANEISHVIKNAALKALDKNNTDLTASTDACRWCKAKPYCTEHTGSIVDMLETTDMKRISDERLVKLMAEKKKILTLLDNIEKVLFDRANAGEVINGVQLTTGRMQNKQWKKDIEPIEELIKLGLHLEQVARTTPITPTQAMKMTEIPEDLYEQPEGKLKLVVNDVTEVLNELEDLT